MRALLYSHLKATREYSRLTVILSFERIFGVVWGARRGAVDVRRKSTGVVEYSVCYGKFRAQRVKTNPLLPPRAAGSKTFNS